MTQSDSVPPMTPEEARAWAAAWRRAAPLMEAERRERTNRTSVADAIAALDDAFESALLVRSSDSTGLIEQQSLFARLR